MLAKIDQLVKTYKYEEKNIITSIQKVAKEAMT